MDLAGKRLLLIKPSSLGDVVHAVASAWALKERWPTLHLSWLVNRGLEPLLKPVGCVDATVPFDRNRFKGMLAPLKSQGVTRMEDSALIFRAKFTAKPGEQFVLRREAYRRMQETLLENGIGFAPARVQVEIAESGRPLTETEKQQVAGAAASRVAAARSDPAAS